MTTVANLPWMIWAHSQIGVHELAGIKHNPAVVAYFKAAGHAEIRDDETPWCAAFVGAALARCGLWGTGSLWALSYSNWGTKLNGPKVGAVATKKRVGGGHVFFVAGFDEKFVYALGGNQNDQVCITRIPRSAVFSYRWPPGAPIPSAAAPGVATATVANAKES